MNRIYKELKDLNLMDRFLFAEAIEDKEFYEAVLGIILEKDIALLQTPQAEKEVRSFNENRKIVMDVCAVDDENTLYNTEVQKRNTHNLPKRSRYHCAMIDSNQLKTGTVDFNTLNDLYVILIMPFDLFGKGKYRYTFTSQCEEIPGLHLEDGVTRIFLNTQGKDPENVSDELIAMLKYFEHTTEKTAAAYSSDRLSLIQQKVDAIKNNKEVGVRLMNAYEEKILERQEAYDEGKAKGFSEGEIAGHAKGKLDAICELAIKMKTAGKPLDEISEFTGLSKSEINEL